MSEKYQDYLAANVLNEGNIISYRSLGRALKIHSNAAKEMLYDFHRTQNARKPASVHATYVICGIRKAQVAPQPNGSHQTDGEDSLMSDAPFMMSSSMPGQEIEIKSIPVTTFTLVAEEQFEETKSLYEKITSIHIYSLEPGPLSDICILSDCNRKIAVNYADEDPLETWKQYGTIHNPAVKRRTNRRPPPPLAAQPPSSSTTTAPKTAQSTATAQTAAPKATEAGKPGTAKPPQPKREGSDIFKSFAKKKNEPAAEQREGAHSNPPGALGPSKPEPPTAEDESMKDIPDIPSEADDEGDDESEETAAQRDADAAASREKAEVNRKAKLEREANLRRMMDDDGDDDDEKPDAKDSEGDEAMHEADSGDADAGAEADAADGGQTQDGPPKHPVEDEQQQQYTVSNGRRRGRRRVMKKKTTKDAEGYLVTREEPVWESFSEDEPVAAAAPKPAVAAGAGAGAGAKGKRASTAAKPGQGNIMSFFGKK